MAVHDPEHAASAVQAASGAASDQLLECVDAYKGHHEQVQEKIVAGEVRRFQEMLDSFAVGQRKCMDMHLIQVEHFVSGLPDRLQKALHNPRVDRCANAAVDSSPVRAHSRPDRLAANAGTNMAAGTGTGTESAAGVFSRRATATSVSSANSSVILPAHVLPQSDSMMTIQQEYAEMKKQVSESGAHFGPDLNQPAFRKMKDAFLNMFKCVRCCKIEGYYLGCDRLRRMVHSAIFGKVALTIVILNVGFSAIVSDAEVKMVIKQANLEYSTLPMWFSVVDIIFFALFAFELSLRLVADEVYFFVGEHWKWNLLDMIVVLSTAVDTLSKVSAPNINFVRIVRLLRVIRSMKVMRIVRYFHAMRVMVLQITNSLKPMIWAFLFLGLVILMFALVFTQGVISYFEDLEYGRLKQSTESQELGDLCGSFLMSVLSLFMSISGGINWLAIVKPLMQVSPVYVALFILYILVLMIGVLNIIVGIFVDSATNAAAKDREALAHEEIEKNQALMKGLEELFDDLDGDKVGTISWMKFEEVSRRSEVRARFATLELDVANAQEVFKLIDVNDNGFVAIDEFVVGIMRSKGLAKRTDVHTLLYQISQMVKHLQRLRRWTADRFDGVETRIEILHRQIDSHNWDAANHSRFTSI